MASTSSDAIAKAVKDYNSVIFDAKAEGIKEDLEYRNQILERLKKQA